jgi:hypothetical protein
VNLWESREAHARAAPFASGKGVPCVMSKSRLLDVHQETPIEPFSYHSSSHTRRSCPLALLDMPKLAQSRLDSCQQRGYKSVENKGRKRTRLIPTSSRVPFCALLNRIRSGRRCEYKHIFRVRVRVIFHYPTAVTFWVIIST